MTFLMISMLPTHLMQARLVVHFRGVVLHAGHERKRPKSEAVESIDARPGVLCGSR
jgi:hypothetical protein